MVLESILSVGRRPGTAITHLYKRVFTLSVFASIVGMAFAYFLFPAHASVLWVALVTVAAMPFMVSFFKEEERGYVADHSLGNFFERNLRIIGVFFVFFLGVILITSVILAFGPPDVTDALFDEQISTLEGIKSLNKAITGQQIAVLGTTAPCTDYEGCAYFIMENNLGVLVIIFIASFLYGAGAIFEITWNASILGTFAGLSVAEFLAVNLGGSRVEALGQSLYNLLGFLPHGMFEITGFSLGAIAGAIISAGLSRGAGPKEFSIILRDAFKLLFLGVIAIVLAAFIEVSALGF